MKKYGILIVIFLLLAAGYGLYLQHGNALQDTGDREEEKGHYPVTISNYTSSGEAKDYIFTRRPQRGRPVQQSGNSAGFGTIRPHFHGIRAPW